MIRRAAVKVRQHRGAAFPDTLTYAC